MCQTAGSNIRTTGSIEHDHPTLQGHAVRNDHLEDSTISKSCQAMNACEVFSITESGCHMPCERFSNLYECCVLSFLRKLMKQSVLCHSFPPFRGA